MSTTSCPASRQARGWPMPTTTRSCWVTAERSCPQPVAILLVAVVHFIPDADDPLAIIGQFRDVMAPGSYLAITHVHHHAASDAAREVAAIYAKASAPLIFRTRDQIMQLFTGFELIDPGVVTLPEWRPEPRPYPSGEVWGLAGLGRIGAR